MSDPTDRRTDISDLTQRRWREIEVILDVALDLEPGEWPAVVADACEGDPALRREVDSLLARYPALVDFLAAPAVEPPSAGSDPGLPSFEGRRLGPYRIVRELARGGMGWVFLAERADGQFDKQVALKLLRPTAHRR